GSDGKVDDVRPQPGAGVFRYASSARGCSWRGERQLQVVVNRFGNRQYRGVSQAGSASESEGDRGQMKWREQGIPLLASPQGGVERAIKKYREASDYREDGVVFRS